MTSGRLVVAAALASALWAAPRGEAQYPMSRGVYVGGAVHYMSVGGDSSHMTVTHQSGAVDTTKWTWTSTQTDVSPAIAACTPGGGFLTKMNAAVFGNQLFLAFTGWPQCVKANGSHAYVIPFDVGTRSFGNLVDLGPVHHANDSSSVGVGTSAGAAIAVSGGLLYVFTDVGTHTSGDGVSWTSYPQVPLSFGWPAYDPDMEPLDAVTYLDPKFGPQIVIVYGKHTDSKAFYWDQLKAAHWNGQTGPTGDTTVLDLTSLVGLQDTRSASLFAGTASPRSAAGFNSGAKSPAVQLFVEATQVNSTASWSVLRRLEYTFGTGTYNWTADPHVDGTKDFPEGQARFFPWFAPECGAPGDVLRQVLVGNYLTGPSTTAIRSFTSDVMVPENRTATQPSCQDGPGIGTDTSASPHPADMPVLRKYWSLVGVILGSPPFAINGVTDTYEVGELSNVTYGQTGSAEVESTQERSNTVLGSAGMKVAGGLKHPWEAQAHMDLGFKKAWEQENGTISKSTSSYAFPLGTVNSTTDDPSNLGRFGWAIFAVPTISVQDYAIYAYDWSPSTFTGTYLDQNVHSIRTLSTGVSFQKEGFELANPGGPNDDVPGLMSGMGATWSRSTNLSGWSAGWEADSGSYTTLLGTGKWGEPKLNSLSFGADSNASISFSKELSSVTTTGQTTDVDLGVSVSLGLSTKLDGFEAGVEAELAAGYAGSFGSTLTTTDTLGTEVEASLSMHPCSVAGPDCVGTLQVQPYYLKALDETAPWIPTAYAGQLPWAIAWQVTGWTPAAGGARSGLSPAADEGTGLVVGGSGGSSTEKGSSYSIRGGRMGWVERGGRFRAIPMTAGEFDPALGATLGLNGYTWSSARADGKWSRRGKVWTFATRKSSSRDVVTLKLDFGAGTWELDLSKALLSPYLRASETRAHLKLNVNGRYEFTFDSEHDIASQWDLVLPQPSPELYGLGRFTGSYDSSKGKGTVTLEGTLPEGLKHFGDVSLRVNGFQVNIPLRLHEDFQSALALGRKLVWKEGGVKLTVDFGKKSWSARFRGNAFSPRHTPRLGRAKIELLVGGETRYSGSHAIENYTSTLGSRFGARSAAGERAIVDANDDGPEDD